MRPSCLPAPVSPACARLACLTLLLNGFITSSHAQITVYSQPAVYPGSTTISAWTSSSGSPDVTSDNFSLTSVAKITGITWQGMTFNVNTGFSQGTEPTSFDIEFRTNNGGIPGTVLVNEVVTPSKTLAGSYNFFNTGPLNAYNYTATLSGAFTASSGTPFWVSIIGVEPSPDYWLWLSGTGGDKASYQEISTGGSTARQDDRAFALTITPAVVPEPSTPMSFGLLLTLCLGRVLVVAKRNKPAELVAQFGLME